MMLVYAPTMVGNYRLVERVATGGMGLVFRAEHLRLGRTAAVKLVPLHRSRPEELRRFEREADSVAQLEHPNILALWDYGEQDGVPYLVMPYIRGGTLKERLEGAPVPLGTVLAYMRQLASALDYAHEQGIIHRDVKPANVLLNERGHLYLADFGIARVVDEADRLTGTNLILGTPEYMAPEQLEGKADARTDLYALGILLYQMLTGRVPYRGPSALSVLREHLSEPLPLEPLRGLDPALPPGVEAVLARALAKQPDERYQSAWALVEALEAALAPPAAPLTLPLTGEHGAPDAGDAPLAPSSARGPRWTTRRRAAMLLVPAFALVLVLLLGGRLLLGEAPAAVLAPATVSPRGDSPTLAPAAAPAAAATVAPPTATPAPTAAPSPTATPAPPIPAGWQRYQGTTLPIALAYPPDWTVDDSRSGEGKLYFVAPDGITFVQLYIGRLPNRDANIDVLRDAYFQGAVANCAQAGVEATSWITVAGIVFADLAASCARDGQLFKYAIGAGLNNGVEWDYWLGGRYGDFAANQQRFLRPLLDSLVIVCPDAPASPGPAADAACGGP